MPTAVAWLGDTEGWAYIAGKGGPRPYDACKGLIGGYVDDCIKPVGSVPGRVLGEYDSAPGGSDSKVLRAEGSSGFRGGRPRFLCSTSRHES